MNIPVLFPGFIIALIIVLYYERKIRRTEPRNKVHFYVTRAKNGTLWLYMGKPIKKEHFYVICNYGIIIASVDRFSGYGLDKNDYANLKWEDEPVEVFLNLED